MSLTIWTRCGGRSNARALHLAPWRTVESQFVNSTRKLVDSNAEQQQLEELIDTAKPPVDPDVQALNLHYLLFTPFRHPPLLHGSRFGRRTECGVFYGAKELETCLAEVAYYRLVFLEGAAALDRLATEHTAFQADVRTERGVDLTQEPFAAHKALLSSKTDYSATQKLGAEMRADGVQVALYPSARAHQSGTGVAVFDPAAFASPQPTGEQSWLCSADRGKVEFRRKNLLAAHEYTFPRADFLVAARLPAPAVR